MAKKVGLDQQTIDFLAVDQTSDTLSTEERVAHEFTHRLVTEHQVNQALYRKSMGEENEADLT